MLMYSLLSAYFDDVIPQQPALSNDGKQQQPALGDFTSPRTSYNTIQHCRERERYIYIYIYIYI
jgi:hypothetical protein